MSADGNAIVPVDVVQGIVQELATVSQHTSSAGNETEGYDDDGGGLGGSGSAQWEPGSG